MLKARTLREGRRDDNSAEADTTHSTARSPAPLQRGLGRQGPTTAAGLRVTRLPDLLRVPRCASSGVGHTHPFERRNTLKPGSGRECGRGNEAARSLGPFRLRLTLPPDRSVAHLDHTRCVGSDTERAVLPLHCGGHPSRQVGGLY